jgi:hypothetical protein
MTQRLLELVGPVHVIGGLLLFASGFSPSAQSLLEALVRPPADASWSPFFVSVLGPTIASWGVLFGTLTRQYFTSPTKKTWNALTLSLLIWAPLDSALCVFYRFYSGAIVNAIVFIAVIGLLIAARKHIR